MGGCLIAYAGAGSEAAKNAPVTRNRNKGDRAGGVVEPLLQSGKDEVGGCLIAYAGACSEAA